MIIKALERAYECARKRNWKKIYWCIDLHGVCFPSSYTRGDYRFIHGVVVSALKTICEHPESVVILWSSCHPEEHADIIKFFAENGIRIDYFNENPEIPNTVTGCFDKKFYVSIIIDDKAGFDPIDDWRAIEWELNNNEQMRL